MKRLLLLLFPAIAMTACSGGGFTERRDKFAPAPLEITVSRSMTRFH